ncbi:hypothetical protein PWG15_05430 [Ensifer adhaerens]|uniref:hypothetical protein n=1 Tax=Ensifer adhaerens TaxID=106592 RepID=UPI0023A96CF8|nr:hypothetical protein [Ensifer adhaerens]WDZ77946.1 hypothetical protein PWG15_05430 [Ensifer adhaerens]
MKTFLDRLTFNAADAGAGAAAVPAAAAPVPAAGTPPAGTETPPAPSAAAAPPAGAGDPPAGGAFYRPDGLAQHMLGKDQNETMDNMHKALEGYRTRDASNGVPESSEAYGQFTGEIPEAIKPHLDTLTADPLFGRVATKALELKVPVATYQALTQEFLSVSNEMGMMEPVVDAAAERAALTPDAAKHLPDAEQQRAREQRMNDNYAFVDGLVTRGLTTKDDAEFAKAMLGDTAKGHRFFESMRKLAAGGEGGGPALGHQPSPADPKGDIQRRQALPENTWGDPKFNQQSYDQLQADLRRTYGD